MNAIDLLLAPFIALAMLLVEGACFLLGATVGWVVWYGTMMVSIALVGDLLFALAVAMGAICLALGIGVWLSSREIFWSRLLGGENETSSDETAPALDQFITTR